MFIRSLSPVALCLAVAASTSCTSTEPFDRVADASTYFGLQDTTLTYTSEAGVSSTATLTRESKNDEAAVFAYVSRTSGFVDADRSFALRVTAQNAHLIRLNDCVTSCEQPQEPVPFLRQPTTIGQNLDTEVTVDVRQGEAFSERTERHTTNVDEKATFTIAGTDYEGLKITWTRVAGDDVTVLRFGLVPDVGIVWWDVGGVQYTLTEVPRTLEPA